MSMFRREIVANAVESYGELFGGEAASDDISPAGGSVKGFELNKPNQTIRYVNGLTKNLYPAKIGDYSYVSAQDLKNTEKARTKVGVSSCTYIGAGLKQKVISVDVYQAANKKVITYSVPVVKRTALIQFAAEGGSVNLYDGLTYSQVITETYSSGYTNSYSINSGGVISFQQYIDVEGYSLNAQTGVVTCTKNFAPWERDYFIVSIEIDLNGKTGYLDVEFSQEAGNYVFAATQTVKQAGANLNSLSNVPSYTAVSDKGTMLYVKEEFSTNGFGTVVTKPVYENSSFSGIAMAIDGNYLTLSGFWDSKTPYFLSASDLSDLYDSQYGNGRYFIFTSKYGEMKTVTLISRFLSNHTENDKSGNYHVGIMKNMDDVTDENDVFFGGIESVVLDTDYVPVVVGLIDGDLGPSDFGKAMRDSYVYKTTGNKGYNLNSPQRDFWNTVTFPPLYVANMEPTVYYSIINPNPSSAGYAAMYREKLDEGLDNTPSYNFKMEAVDRASYKILFYDGYILNADNNYEQEGPWECYVTIDSDSHFERFTFEVPGREDLIFDLADLGYEGISKLDVWIGVGHVQIYTMSGEEVLQFDYYDNGAHDVAYPVRAVPCIIDAHNVRLTEIQLFVS